MTTKQIARKPKSDVIEPTSVTSRDALMFVRPSLKADRIAAYAGAVQSIRDLVAKAEGIGNSLLGYLVLILFLDPTTSTDDKGKVTDALTALQEGEGAVKVDRSKVSQARAAYVLARGADVNSTEHPLWLTVLHVAGKQGVGAERIVKALEGRGSKQRAIAALEGISKARGDAKAAAVRKVFPGAKATPGTGSKAWQAADRGYQALVKAEAMPTADGGMTDAERATLAGLLTALVERLSGPAPAKADK